MTKASALQSTNGQQVSEAQAQAPHLDFLDGLRGMAALFVVLHHAYLQTWPAQMYPDAKPSKLVAASLGWLIYGQFPVTFFIALSGFCLMIPVIRSGSLRGGTKGFLLGRVRRILPPYYSALVLSVFVVSNFLQYPSHTWYDLSLPITTKGILAHVLLIQNLHWSWTEINGPLWTTALEFQIYLLFPFLVWIWARRGIVPVLALTAALSLSLCLLVRGGHITMHAPQFVFIFALGMFAALHGFRFTGGHQSTGSDRIFKITGVISVALTAVALWAHWDKTSTEPVLDILVGITSACLLILVTRNDRGLIRRLANWPPLVWVGGFSFSLYLIHLPLQQLFWQLFVQPNHFNKPLGFALVAVAGTGTILLISFGFAFVLERPFMRSRPRSLGWKPTSRWREETIPLVSSPSPSAQARDA